MKCSMSIRILLIIVLVLFAFGGCTQSMKITASKGTTGKSVESKKHENATIKPDIPNEVNDIRMDIIEAPYIAPSQMDNFRNVRLMQIVYGYNVDGVWYDYPCENYDLIGIFDGEDPKDVFHDIHIPVGSHMVRIGQYLLINLSFWYKPDVEYTVSDTLGSEVLEPFSQYYTYQSYEDESGNWHFYLDDHSYSYGYFAEDTLTGSNKTEMTCEFPRRYYIILDYESIPDDYELSFTVPRVGYDEMMTYVLTAEKIHQLVEK